MTSNTQKFTVAISFTYEADVFDEDPNDVYDLARLEAYELEPRIQEMASFLGNVEALSYTVEPVL